MKRFDQDTYLRIGIIIGGIYDLVLGGSLLFPDLIPPVLSIGKPNPEIYSYVVGLFLIAVGYLLLISSQDVTRLAFIGVGSCFVRLGFALIAVLSWLTIGIETGYLLLAMTDTITAAFILIPMVLTEGISWTSLWQV
ncbi:MAG: hypothetical protein ACFFE8_13280 [Candidatus Heimdallarchaeota archaeon]